MPRRTRVASMLRYSARPPETPDSMRWLRERRRTLPDRFEKGALEFVMSPTLPSRTPAPHRDPPRPPPDPTPAHTFTPPLTTFVYPRYAVPASPRYAVRAPGVP